VAVNGLESRGTVAGRPVTAAELRDRVAEFHEPAYESRELSCVPPAKGGAAPRGGFQVLRQTRAWIMLEAGTVLPGCHPWSLCSCLAGGRKQGGASDRGGFPGPNRVGAGRGM
jgi:hypothetical protein